jgi:tRNA-modifying protein YgfZ
MQSLGKTTINFMRVSSRRVVLDSVGVLRVRGADVIAFLQGQLSNDLARAAPDRSLLAGYHNPQGRTIALLRCVALAADDLLALVPRELSAAVMSRLTKFILRAKVRLSDESTQWAIEGVLAPAALAGAADALDPRPATAGGVLRVGDSSIVRIGESAARLLVIRPAAAPSLLEALPSLSVQEWRLGAIGAGEPQVYAATSEEFVAQMLNLDVLDAVAFDKGCYTGQEVIARAHYRGRVKRRMQRFLTQEPRALQPGDTGALSDGRSFRVVEAAQHADGRCEFLAVSALRGPDAGAAALEPAAHATGGLINATQLDLPYALPE